jgi:hypothetical protein
MKAAPCPLFFFDAFPFFDRHVLELAGLEDVAAFLAFHVFGIFVAGNDLHPGMLALLPADLPRGLRRLARRHKLRALSWS